MRHTIITRTGIVIGGAYIPTRRPDQAAGGYGPYRRRRRTHPVDRLVMRAAIVCAAALAVMLAAQRANAQPFVELGVGTATGGCIADGWDRVKTRHGWALQQQCSSGTLGLAALGYSTRPLTVLPGAPRAEARWEHWSSLESASDRGVEILSARLRWEF